MVSRIQRAPGPIALAALLTLASCRTIPPDPTILVEAGGAVESGVSTDYGVVFLGSTARGGEVTFTAFFHDGPSREVGVIEPLGGGLFTTESPIVLPVVPIEFAHPAPGDELVVLARFGSRVRTIDVEVASHPSIEGLFLRMNGDLDDLGPAQVGSGVYVGGADDRRLVGLISGRVRVDAPDGSREYMTVVGSDDLWRLAAYQREITRKKRWVYREDIL